MAMRLPSPRYYQGCRVWPYGEGFGIFGDAIYMKVSPMQVLL